MTEEKAVPQESAAHEVNARESSSLSTPVLESYFHSSWWKLPSINELLGRNTTKTLIPQKVLGGRVRTSTIVLIFLLFLLSAIKHPEATTPRGPQDWSPPAGWTYIPAGANPAPAPSQNRPVPSTHPASPTSQSSLPSETSAPPSEARRFPAPPPNSRTSTTPSPSTSILTSTPSVSSTPTSPSDPTSPDSPGSGPSPTR